MKKIIVLVFAVIVTACQSASPPASKAAPAVNPEKEPVIRVEIPSGEFSPDPDIADDKLMIAIAVEHPVPIKDWTIQIHPDRRGQGGQGGGQRQGGGEARQGGEGAGRQRAEGEEGQQRQRTPRPRFFEAKGTGTPPAQWGWNGKNTDGTAMAISAMDYRFTLTVSDEFENTATYEGKIEMGVIVRRDGDLLRIVVTDINFPGGSADFARLSDEDRRSNERVLRLIGRALTKFDGYQITVEGHANPDNAPGTPARANEESRELGPLSRLRAQAVVDYLVTHDNIARTRLAAVGMGATMTVIDRDSDDFDEESWRNRRVEFILKKG